MHALAKKTIRTIANVRDLEAMLGQIQVELRGTGNLTSRAKRSYRWFAELASRGFTSVRAPLGAHAHLQWLAFGETKSISTIQRSFVELESQGLIRRLKCRRGDISTIEIEVSRFNFYIQRHRQFKDPPCGTYSYPSVHRSNCDADEITGDISVSNSQRSHVVTTSLLSKKNAKKEKRTFADWIHPLVFTLGVVCYNLGQAERERLQRAAVSAIADKEPPFDYWTPERWQAMAIPVREKTARELLPALRELHTRYERTREESPPPRRRESPPPPRYEPEPIELERENLGQWFGDFADRMKIPICERQSEETVLDEQEAQLLYWADQNNSKG